MSPRTICLFNVIEQDNKQTIQQMYEEWRRVFDCSQTPNSTTLDSDYHIQTVSRRSSCLGIPQQIPSHMFSLFLRESLSSLLLR